MKFTLSAVTSLLTIALVGMAADVDAKKHHKHHEVQTRNNAGHELGLPWGCDPSCVNGVKSTQKTDIMWYHHWQDTRVAELDNLGFDYVPTFWGPTKWDRWNAVKSELNQGPLPKYMLAFNEPDVQGQSDIGPKAAAKLWMQELKPWADKGVKVGSPQVCWNMQWLEQFMSECKKRGCNISFIALHWYGSWQDFDKFTNWISSVHDAFGLPIWITEYGITQASGGTQKQIKHFHIKAVEWMRAQGYVQRSAWLGGFPVNQKPDPYPSNLNSYFNGDGSARDLYWWASSAGGAQMSVRAISKREHREDDEVKKAEVEQYDEEHCDYKCQLRLGSIEKHHRKKNGIVYLNDKHVCVATPSKLDREERKKLSVCLKQAGLLSHKALNETKAKFS